MVLNCGGKLAGYLDRFGDASGLRVNVGKCVAVHLGVERCLQHEFPVAKADAASRLLGGQVATESVAATTWALTLQQVRMRLHWAELKTTNELQRVKLLRAVLLPKFLFVARHDWPTATTIDKFQRLVDNFVWGGSLATSGPRRRAWTSQHVARAAAVDGGLSVPHLTHELQALSLATVERWAQPVGGVLGTIGQHLLQRRAGGASDDGLLAPTRRDVRSTPTLLASLAATGVQLRRALAATPRSAEEMVLTQQLLKHVGRGTSQGYGWDRDWLVVDYTRAEADIERLRRHQGLEFGNLQVDALLRARIVGDGILLTARGTDVQCGDFPGLFRATDRVADVVELAWDDSGKMRFRSVRHETPLAPSVTDHFRRFCDTISFNYPGILRPPAQPEDLILRPASLDVWKLRNTGTGCVVEWNPVERVTVQLGAARSTEAATALARKALKDHSVSFERHTWLDAPFALWTGVAPPTRAAARELLAGTSRAHAQAEQAARQQRWRRADPVIADALQAVPWSRVLNAAGVPATHRLLFHKLKGDRLSGWDRLEEQRGCPHCPAIGAAGGTAHHIMWACPRAQARWTQLLRFWEPLSLSPRALHGDDVKRDVFGLKLSVLPGGVWQHPELRRLGEPSSSDTVATSLAMNAVWRRQVLLTFHVIWRWRTAPDTSAEIWSEAQARAQHGASLLAVHANLRWERVAHSAASAYTAAALDVLFAATERPPLAPAQTEAPGSASYLLFFDGGSRGNPGPGGSGAVVVKVDSGGTGASVIWSAAVSSSAPSTTNNQAEYVGLLTGLQAAKQHQWTPLAVIGDSQLILRQMDEYRPPKNKQLLELYAPVRRLADTLRVTTWRHHYRSFNKMADAAANAAMDSALTSQAFHPTDQQAHTRIADHLSTDFAQWQVVFFGT